MKQVFEALEEKQPVQYKLPPLVKQYAEQAHWSLVLDAARGKQDVFRRQDFSLLTGLSEVVRLSGQGLCRAIDGSCWR